LSTIPESEPIEVQSRGTSHAAPVASPPSLGQLLWLWLSIGAQSFGGGSATLYLIRRAVIEERGWLTEQEFMRYWAICQLSPGINLLGMTVLIGWHVAGAPGVALSLAGLLLPSVSITVLLAAFYTSVRDLPIVQAALRGIIPATIGLGILLALRMARPILTESRLEGRGSLLLSIVLLIGSALLFAMFHPPVMLLLWLCGAVGACAAWWKFRNR
jgi:chromate transporter